MSISLTCPECFQVFTVNDSLEGKRVRCKHCEAAVRVTRADDFVEDDAITGSADFDEGQDLPRVKKSKTRNQASSPNFWHRFLVYASRNPWVGMVLFFLLIWVPLSFIFTQQIVVINVIIVLLAMLGCAIGTLASLTGIAMSNPFEVITSVTVGALLSQVTSSSGSAGRLTAKMTRQAGMKNLGDIDTGAAGRMAVYCGVVLVVFLAHVTALSFVLVSRLN